MSQDELTLAIPLNLSQLKFIIDAMWELDPYSEQRLCIGNKTSAPSLEKHLQSYLSCGLNYIDSVPVDKVSTNATQPV